MAIDKNRTRELLDSIDEFFDSVVGGLPGEVVRFLKTAIMGPAFQEIRKLIEESRPPVLFLIGRSGHGKSSLINGLAGREAAPVGDIKPTTPESTAYLIHFEEQFSAWQVIDSRGFFESTRPDGAPASNAVDHLLSDIQKHKPDVIMHVISAPEIRNLGHDLEVHGRIMKQIRSESGMDAPTIVVLNKADTLGNPREWPPEEHARKAALIQDALSYMGNDILRTKTHPIDRNVSIRGYGTDDPSRPGIIPACSLPEDAWNLDTLSDFIGGHLPESALLDFYQALRRKEQLRKISTALIKRFSVIASGIGASPAPLSDFVVLTPLQILMITMVGGLSCRPVSRETAHEYLSAVGINLITAGGARYVTRQLLKFIPFAGWAAAGSIAGSSTYALGKAAEAYFFSGTAATPDAFRKDWDRLRPETQGA